MKKLTKEQILMIHNELIRETGGSVGLRDEGLLDSALNSFQSTKNGSNTQEKILLFRLNRTLIELRNI